MYVKVLYVELGIKAVKFKNLDVKVKQIKAFCKI